MKKILVALVVLIVLGFAIFSYATRDLAAPSGPVQTEDVESAGVARAGVYRISDTDSQARYELDELLRGSPKHVVGTTTAITGEIEIVDGVIAIRDISINARTFQTDSEKRDNAVGRYILKSEEPANEFITLRNIVVTEASGLVEAGRDITAKATGDLTIAGVTKQVVFQIEGMLKEEGLLEGTATATVKRSDFNLKIPEIQSVTNVSDEVVLTVHILARAAQ